MNDDLHKLCHAHEQAAHQLGEAYLASLAAVFVDTLGEPEVTTITFPPNLLFWKSKGANGTIRFPWHSQLDASGKDITVFDAFIDHLAPFERLWTDIVEEVATEGMKRLMKAFPNGLAATDASQVLPTLLGPERSTSLLRNQLEEVLDLQVSAEAAITRRFRV